MDRKMTPIETPAWMLDLFRAIDSLDLSEGGPFSIFADDVYMNFGGTPVKGIADVKTFFEKLDAPYVTVHNVTGVWNLDDFYFMQGSADLTKRGDPASKTIHAAPLINLIWLNEAGKIQQYIVAGPPSAAKAVLGS